MEEPKTCETCRHFVRHFIKQGRSYYVPIQQGHCVEPRLKDRTVKTPACGRYSCRPDRT